MNGALGSSPPTKKMLNHNLGYFDNIELMKPIKIQEMAINEASLQVQGETNQALDEDFDNLDEEEDSDDAFQFNLKPMNFYNDR